MRGGRLRHRIVLERPTTTADAKGGEVVTYADATERWADVRPLSAREYFASQQTQMEISHLVTMRFDPDLPLGPKWRVRFGARRFDIESLVLVDERRHEWQLRCRELV